eukprot:COSAG01_NODE_973_length_12368_cov_12.435732_6_plen_177_part_00
MPSLDGRPRHVGIMDPDAIMDGNIPDHVRPLDDILTAQYACWDRFARQVTTIDSLLPGIRHAHSTVPGDQVILCFERTGDTVQILVWSSRVSDTVEDGEDEIEINELPRAQQHDPVGCNSSASFGQRGPKQVLSDFTAGYFKDFSSQVTDITTVPFGGDTYQLSCRSCGSSSMSSI